MSRNDRYAYFGMGLFFIATILLVWMDMSWRYCIALTGLSLGLNVIVTLIGAAIVIGLRQNVRVLSFVFPFFGVSVAALIGLVAAGLLAASIQAIRGAF